MGPAISCIIRTHLYSIAINKIGIFGKYSPVNFVELGRVLCENDEHIVITTNMLL